MENKTNKCVHVRFCHYTISKPYCSFLSVEAITNHRLTKTMWRHETGVQNQLHVTAQVQFCIPFSIFLCKTRSDLTVQRHPSFKESQTEAMQFCRYFYILLKYIFFTEFSQRLWCANHSFNKFKSSIHLDAYLVIVAISQIVSAVFWRGKS